MSLHKKIDGNIESSPQVIFFTVFLTDAKY